MLNYTSKSHTYNWIKTVCALCIMIIPSNNTGIIQIKINNIETLVSSNIKETLEFALKLYRILFYTFQETN